MPTRPREYQSACTVTGEIAYEVRDAATKGTHAGRGNLSTGRVVWVSEPLSEKVSDGSVLAYAEGIGVISVERQSLAPSTHI